MNAKRRTFRVEAMSRPRHGGAEQDRPYQEIMVELRALRTLVQPREELTERMIKDYKAEIAEADKLKAELDLIYAAINETKHELATLHVTGFEGPEMKRVTHELDAIVDGTASATESILGAAEFIDQAASSLAAVVKSEHDK